MQNTALGLALIVTNNGQIDQVLFNNINDQISVGKLFPTILHPGEFPLALDFLHKLKTAKLLFEVPLSLTVNKQPKSFYFTGTQSGDKFILMATSSQGMDSSLYDEIAKINNELANQLRDNVKQNLQPQGLSEPQLDEFTKLNNELVNIQRELSKSNNKLEVLNEKKNELIGVAAHDLRNPLGVISGYIQFVMGTSDNLSDSQKQMLQKAVDTATKMTSMLEELLDMSELESGKVNLNLSQVDLNEILIETVELNQVIAEKKHINIEYQSNGLLMITIDAPKVEQVINNFISNSIKYSHQNTTIKVSLSIENGSAWVRVVDEGQGIPKDELHKVFAPFVTTSVQSTGGEKSTGLGLAITQKVIEAHKGHIGVNSEVGVGSEFYFSLPKPD